MINEFGKSFFSYKGVGHLYRVPTWSIFLKDYIVLTHYFSWQIFWTLSGAIKLTYGINWLRFKKRDFLLFPLCMDNTEREQLNLSLVNSILYHRLIRGSDQWWHNGICVCMCVSVCVCVSEYVCVFLWVCMCVWVGGCTSWSWWCDLRYRDLWLQMDWRSQCQMPIFVRASVVNIFQCSRGKSLQHLAYKIHNFSKEFLA